MRRFAAMFALALAAVLLLPVNASAGATIDVGVLWNPNPDSDAQVFLHASNVAYPVPRTQIMPVFREIANPYDDYPVLAFIASQSHADIRAIWSYRNEGRNWFHVMLHFGVTPDMLFVALPRDPGPPYGKAYGIWRKHGNRTKGRWVGDEDVRFWVRTRTAARYAKVTPAQAWQWHESGKSYESVTCARYKQQHGRALGHDKQNTNSQGHGNGHTKHD